MLYYKNKFKEDRVRLISGTDFIDIIFKIGQLNDLYSIQELDSITQKGNSNE